MEKLKIAVLFGGCSPEYEISLQSAYSVITNMDPKKYEPILFGITKTGEWFHYTGSPEKIKNGIWNNLKDCSRAIISPDRKTKGALIFDSDHVFRIRLDAAMPVIHGRNGEDGTIQGLLELADIPVIGCGTLASALCLDKNRAHKIVEAAGVPVPRSFTLRADISKKNNRITSGIKSKAENLGYPLFVKPVNCGSSFGISKVSNQDDLIDAVGLAFGFDNEVIVEECIEGIEIGCSVIGDDELLVGEIDEIEIPGGFFDFKEKYTLETSAIHVPARICERKSEEAKETAKTIYKTLGCSGFARVDMFLTREGKIIFNEVNTIPGFTTHSRFPNMLKAAGLDFGQIIDMIIQNAVNSCRADIGYENRLAG